jgi:hypothetical protein
MFNKECFILPDKKDAQARQGDVFVERVDNRELEDKVCTTLEGKDVEGRTTLAYGEATNHSHSFYTNSQNVHLKKAKNSPVFFLIVKKETGLKHEEHGEIMFPCGEYKPTRQMEWVPGKVRVVAD